MEPRAWFVSATVVALMVALATNRLAVDLAMMGALTLLLVGDVIGGGGILDIPGAMAGFSNPALLLIAALFIVAAGLERTGAIEKVARVVLGHPRRESGAIFRLTVPVALMSSVMNNTPIVAMYLAIVRDWSKRLGMSASKLYMPLSFAAILGGKLTLFGTASNMVVLGLYRSYVEGLGPERAQSYQLSQLQEFWGVAALGLPTALVGVGLMVGASRWLIPARRPVENGTGDVKRFYVGMCISDGAPVVGKTVQEAGLRQLPGLFLAHVERNGQTQVADPEFRLQSGDRLAFVGALDSVLDLRKVPGLIPADRHRSSKPQSDTMLVEAVIAARSALVGRSVREANFRAMYNAAIWAVHRNGERLGGRIGDIRLRPGDTLLLEARPSVAEVLRHSPDFYLTSLVRESSAIRHDRANVALAIMVLMVLAITTTSIPAPVIALLGAAAMILTRCIRSAVARAAINWQVLVVIGAALGIGQAMQNSGAATQLAVHVVQTFSDASPSVMIFVLFLITSVFSQLITNNGAAVLMFPICMEVAESSLIHPHAAVFTLMVAAGSTFLSPISYQTNLMVYGPGAYRFLDFARLGLPLTVLIGVTCALLAPRVYGSW